MAYKPKLFHDSTLSHNQQELQQFIQAEKVAEQNKAGYTLELLLNQYCYTGSPLADVKKLQILYFIANAHEIFKWYKVQDQALRMDVMRVVLGEKISAQELDDGKILWEQKRNKLIGRKRMYKKDNANVQKQQAKYNQSNMLKNTQIQIDKLFVQALNMQQKTLNKKYCVFARKCNEMVLVNAQKPVNERDTKQIVLDVNLVMDVQNQNKQIKESCYQLLMASYQGLDVKNMKLLLTHFRKNYIEKV